MRIAYRRLSGAIGVTPSEVGARGIWWEKRRALLASLLARGHNIDFVGRLTRASEAQHRSVAISRNHDLLLLEFGSTNQAFYGRDLEASYMMLARHRGPVVFLCDDPDLPLDWAKAEMLGAERFTLWFNATRGQMMRGLTQALQARVRDFPFASLMSPRRPSMTQATPDYLVYLGRPLGRANAINRLLVAGAPFRVFSKPKDWTRYAGLDVVAPPNQPDRAAFYAAQRGSLVLADLKHKMLGWRTGRAYHALLAGCPALVESDHEALREIGAYRSPEEVAARVAEWADPRARAQAWERGYAQVEAERRLCDAAFSEAGL